MKENYSTEISEQELAQAERVEQYLHNLETGDISVPPDTDTDLLKFVRAVKVAAKPAPSNQVVMPDEFLQVETPRQQRRSWWYWLTPLPIVGFTIVGLWFWFKPVNVATKQLASTTFAEDLIAIDQFDADLAVMTAELDRSLREIDALTVEDLSAL